VADHTLLVAGMGDRRRHLLARSHGRTLELGRKQSADDPGLEDGTYDTVVSLLTLCSVPDLDRTVRRIRDLLKPDGQLLFLEHMRAPGVGGRLQQLAAPVAERMIGCRLDRDLINVLRAADLPVTDLDRFTVPIAGLVGAHCVAGVAKPRARPAPDANDSQRVEV
jgi:SAM-dependent methyltransferase